MFDITSVEIFVIRVLQTGNEEKKENTHTHAHTRTHNRIFGFLFLSSKTEC